MSFITGWLVSYGAELAIGTVGTFVVGWILKKIPTGKFSAWAKKVGKAQGLAISKFFTAKWPKLWEGAIEPIVIDTVSALGLGWVSGFLEGLKSDNG